MSLAECQASPEGRVFPLSSASGASSAVFFSLALASRICRGRTPCDSCGVVGGWDDADLAAVSSLHLMDFGGKVYSTAVA